MLLSWAQSGASFTVSCAVPVWDQPTGKETQRHTGLHSLCDSNWEERVLWRANVDIIMLLLNITLACNYKGEHPVFTVSLLSVWNCTRNNVALLMVEMFQVETELLISTLIIICPQSTCLHTITYSHEAMGEFPVLCLSCITNACIVFREARSSFHMEMYLTSPGFNLRLPIWNSITPTAAPPVLNTYLLSFFSSCFVSLFHPVSAPCFTITNNNMHWRLTSINS